MLNVIGNLFRRAKNGVKKIFSSNNCDCGGREESISDSWRREDFPGLRNLFKGKGKSLKKSRNTVIQIPFNGEAQETMTTNPMTFSLSSYFDSKVLAPGLRQKATGDDDDDDDKKKTFIFQGKTYEAGTKLNFNIGFQASKFLIEGSKSNDKTIQDLVKTLKEYPEIKIIIEGNYKATGAESDNDYIKTLQDPKKPMTVKSFKEDRAQFFLNVLKGNGISKSRLGIKKGHSNSLSVTVEFNN
ncbi:MULTISPECIES: hypothetical protein [Flavobacterium]|uniref:OmpA-like domain-containing protein n=1 Tax=Flavobacterium jumunjinense TaxID=998845 RepID=A0ABV5GPR1_9FLAO|nr:MULTISPECIES: hypothetical protein [Flavobacterium]